MKHGGGRVMFLACGGAFGADSLPFIDAVIYDDGSRVISDTHRNILCTTIQRNAST